MTEIQREDILEFVENFQLTDSLVNTKFLITGATGLIGSTLVHCLLALNKNIQITCPIRNLAKAKTIYEESYQKICFVECDLIDYLRSLTSEEKFHYIIHCASPTVGKYMTDYPVETFMLAIDSTHAILEYARHCNVKGVVYISSLEYYGQNFDDKVITEDITGTIDNSNPRNSYSLAKRAAEFLCTAYAKQYGVRVKTARLTQTFGAGVAADDNRVFAQFARSIIAGTDIVMHTKGESAKPYCYTTDCVDAILHILLKGEDGEAYNVANSDTYITIYKMAELLKDNFNPSIGIVVEEHPDMGYAPVTKLHLSSDKLKRLGWEAKYGLIEMFARLIDDIKSI